MSRARGKRTSDPRCQVESRGVESGQPRETQHEQHQGLACTVHSCRRSMINYANDIDAPTLTPSLSLLVSTDS